MPQVTILSASATSLHLRFCALLYGYFLSVGSVAQLRKQQVQKGSP